MSVSKQILSLMPEFIQNTYHSYKNKIQTIRWKRQGKPLPAPHVIKQEMLLEYRNRYNTGILVETGTYYGDMTWAQRNNFHEIYSIELSKEFSEFAKKRFKKNPHIKIIQGDSGKIMSTLIKDIHEKALFWLDGHYSGGDTARGDKDSPILEEVKAILSSDLEHVLLINDARNFTGQRDFPSQEGLSAYIRKSYPDSNIHIENDCIIVELKKNATENV